LVAGTFFSGVLCFSIGIDAGDSPGAIRRPKEGHDRHDRNLSKRLFFASLASGRFLAKTFWPGRQ